MTASLIPKDWTRTFGTLLLAISLATGAVAEMHAQNNPYKINDALFPLYAKASNKRTMPEGLAIADTLMQRALLLHDAKAQCLATIIPLQYAFYQNDEKAFDDAVAKVQQKALETGYTQYYYYAVSNKVTYLLNHNKTYSALVYLEDAQQKALKSDDKYGIYTCMKDFGAIYSTRYNNLMSKKAFMEAYEYGRVNCPEQDLSTNFRRIAEIDNITGNYQEALEYAERGLKIAKTQSARNHIIIEKTKALGMMGKREEFMDSYNQLVKSGAHHKENKTEISIQLEIIKLIVEQEYQKAASMLMKNIEGNDQMPMDKLKLYVFIKKKQNDWKKATELLEIMTRNLYREKQDMQNADLMAISAKFDKNRLENEKNIIALKNANLTISNTRLKLNNTQLTLQNSSLELARSKTSEKLALLNASNYKLYYENKQWEAKKLKDSLDKQRIIQDARQAEDESRQRSTRNTIIALIAVIIVGFAYLLHRNRTARQLREAYSIMEKNNADLKEAKEKAEQADHIKTMFIQNMSHEIRTPLNAIVGFSSIITQMGNELTDEEKNDMSQRIQTNSDLLLTLINDILDISTIESGKYVMKMETVKVNEMMRSTLETVEHRKAPGVTLLMETDADDSKAIITDRNRVKQVLINLLTNAEKNTEHGTITLGFSQTTHPGMLTFSVTDTGIGIPVEKMDEIFERFKKLDDFKQGTGLGLNICAAIASKLGGNIWADKTYTGGARFFFTLQEQ